MNSWRASWWLLFLSALIVPIVVYFAKANGYLIILVIPLMYGVMTITRHAPKGVKVP